MCIRILIALGFELFVKYSVSKSHFFQGFKKPRDSRSSVIQEAQGYQKPRDSGIPEGPEDS